MAAPLTEILLHIVDLGVSHERSYEVDMGGSSAITSFVTPARFLSKISIFKHWTLEVRGTCYEVTRTDLGPAELLAHEPGHNLYILPAEEWHRRRRAKGLKRKTRVLGLTRWESSSIKGLANQIWAKRFDRRWKLASKNCQNFAALLNDLITLNEAESREFPESERRQWYRRPWSLTEHKAFWKSMFGTAAAATHVAVVEYTDLPLMLQIGALVCAVVAAFQSLDIAKNTKDEVWKRQARETHKLEHNMMSTDELRNSRPVTYGRQTPRPYKSLMPPDWTKHDLQLYKQPETQIYTYNGSYSYADREPRRHRDRRSTRR